MLKNRESKVEVRRNVRFFIPVKIEAGVNQQGTVKLLAELIVEMPSNQELRDSELGVRKAAKKNLYEFVRSRNVFVRDCLEMQRGLEPYLPCFTRSDCDDVGIEMRVVDKNDGGPSDAELGAICMELIHILGRSKVKVTRIEDQRGLVTIRESVSEAANGLVARAS